MGKKVVSIVTLIVRTLLGCVCVFSGFVKAIDPLGTNYKIEDYLNAFGGVFAEFTWIALSGSILLSMFEFCLGWSLILNLRPRLMSWLSLLMMLFMTPLTLYIALENPVSDCGCFGDALVLDNWTTFYKNVVLLCMSLWLVATCKRVRPWFMPWAEWCGIGLFACVSVVLSFVCLRHLPFIDFRPYKVGTDIEASMEIPEGAPGDEYLITFVYEKEGVKQEFTLENYPKDDSTWVFVDQKTELISKGYVPPIHDFSITTSDFEDITYDVLDYEGYTLLYVMYDLEKSNKKFMGVLNELYERSQEVGWQVYALTGSEESIVEWFVGETGAGYPICGTDPITLKTIVRANPGVVLIKDGVIVDKWNARDIKVEKVFEKYNN